MREKSNNKPPQQKKKSALTVLDDGRWHQIGSPDHICAHPTPWPDPLPENVPLIDRSCPILAHFGLYYLAPLQSIVCERHGHLLSSGDILEHIMSRKHTSQRTGMDESLIRHAISHLVQSFSLPPEENWSGLVSRVQNKELLCSQLPGIASPSLCQLCEGCLYWIKEGSSTPGKEKSIEWIHRHQSRAKRPMCFQARKNRYEDYRTAYTFEFMNVNCGKKGMRPLKIVAAAHQEENEEASCIHQIPASAVHDDTFPVHFKKLGWEDYLAANPFDYELARMLIRLPNPKHCPLPSSSKKWMTLERALVKVHKFLSQYLSDANQAAQNLHPLFREEITRRSVFMFSV